MSSPNCASVRPNDVELKNARTDCQPVCAMDPVSTASASGTQNTVLAGDDPTAARYRARASGMPGWARNTGR